MIRIYAMLVKPGIIFGNIITTAAGFALASQGHFNYLLFLYVLAGLSCIIGSACVLNNYIDRKSDQKMSRTKNRPLARGLIAPYKALSFAGVLGIMGISILALYTNVLAVLCAAFGLFAYVVLYSLGKYLSVYGTVIGSISGAMPPVVGYCAVSHHFDMAALLLFLIIVLWQMPHFFAIAMYRLDDYQAASIPVLPVKKGNHVTKIHMLLYILAFTLSASLLTFFGYKGYAYLMVVALLGVVWLILSVQGFKSTNDRLWALKMFRYSLVVVMALSVMIACGYPRSHSYGLTVHRHL
ncbi:MAG: protoheme IX farnesyltransferase [Verrucomicrobia bacterium]|nr:protoheme IX farnesyltransferase [Verrucomicrobiota bacterium]MBS0646651.1 protoheme IX farnesyltransferase [Verrucomicrobiota bacterium]